jgi:hypothetical protein
MEHSCVHKTQVLVLILLLAGCAAEQEINAANTDAREANGTDIQQKKSFFLKQIFNKYGDRGVITFEVKHLSHYILAIQVLDLRGNITKEDSKGPGTAVLFPSVHSVRNNTPRRNSSRMLRRVEW